MTIQVTGTLVDPVNQPLANAVIRVKALDTSSVVAASSGKVTVSIAGVYDFTLQEGMYSIEVLQSNKYNKIAYVDIPVGALAATTLETLITTYQYCVLEAPVCAL